MPTYDLQTKTRAGDQTHGCRPIKCFSGSWSCARKRQGLVVEQTKTITRDQAHGCRPTKRFGLSIICMKTARAGCGVGIANSRSKNNDKKRPGTRVQTDKVLPAVHRCTKKARASYGVVVNSRPANKDKSRRPGTRVQTDSALGFPLCARRRQGLVMRLLTHFLQTKTRRDHVHG